MRFTSIIPLPIVLATAVPKMNAAMKLKIAAQTTASRGDSTRVETTVAMLFAASWKPLKKSKQRASRMVTMTRIVALSKQNSLRSQGSQRRPLPGNYQRIRLKQCSQILSALYHNRLDYVCGIFRLIG